MERSQVDELVYQALETEMGGVKVYRTAIRCAQNPDLKKEWKKYLEETEHHEEIVRGLCGKLGLDPEKQTPGRQIVRHKGAALVEAMEMALKSGDLAAAQIVAAECVVDAETKDHQNWELIGQAGKKMKGDAGAALTEAYDEVEDEEDEHLYHTMGWCRELWIESLGMPAQLPPPEEEKSVKTAIGAARAKQERVPAKKATVKKK
jgi:rubrerythrin